MEGAPPALRSVLLALGLAFLLMLGASVLAGGNMHSPFGWVACGLAAASMMRWGVLPGIAAACGAAAAVLLTTDQLLSRTLVSHGVMLTGGYALRHLSVALDVRRDLGRCADVARLFVAVSLAMTVPAAINLLIFSALKPIPSPEWAGLHGLKWSFQATAVTLALLPPTLGFDAGTLRRWRRQPLEVLGLALATTVIAAVALRQLPDLTWVVLLGLPLVAAAAMRVDLAFAGLLGLVCTVAVMLGVEWATVDGQDALAARVSGLVWSYTVLLSGLMLTVHALRAEHTAIEREIQAARARYRIGMLSSAVHEQERIGRSLHLGLGVELGELAAALAALDADARRLEPSLAGDVEAMRAACQRAREAAETVAHGLMPPIDRDGDLGRALRELAARVPAGAGLGITIDCAAGLRLPVDASRDAYRIVQEALNNVLKHSAAQQVAIRLGAHASGAIELVVEDDGVGMGVGAAGGAAREAAGIGLGTMRYRAERAGGTLGIEPRDGGGTRIVALLPRASATAPDPGSVLAGEPSGEVSAAPLLLQPHRGLP